MRLLELHAVTKTYRSGNYIFGKNKSIEAVKQVSFSLDKGMCLGLVGRSGSGKSTLGKMILGLEMPDEGEILFEGKKLWARRGSERRDIRRNLQVVFQDCYSAVNPRLTIGKIVSEPIRNHERLSTEAERRRVEELLEKVGLRGEDMIKYPHQLSGGQLQRVTIARAIALQPKLIVLDEAVSSLDVIVQAQILDLFADLKREFGLSYLFITHDLQAAAYLCDRLAVMDSGQIVEEVDVVQLQHAKHPVTRKLLSSML